MYTRRASCTNGGYHVHLGVIMYTWRSSCTPGGHHVQLEVIMYIVLNLELFLHNVKKNNLTPTFVLSNLYILSSLFSRIGVAGFENPMRDVGTEEIIKQINQVNSQ